MNTFIFNFYVMDLEERRKKFAKWIDEYMQSVNLSLEEAFALSYFYGYEDCIADHNLTAEPVVN